MGLAVIFLIKRTNDMNTDEISQLIRIAQVLKVRSRLLADELAKAKRGPQSGAALNASECAADAEKKLSKVLTDILG